MASSRVGAPAEVGRHAWGAPEPSRRVATDRESDPCVEAERVRIGDNVDMRRAGRCRARGDVVDEQAADSLPHDLGLDEQIVELAPASAEGQHAREPEAPPACVLRLRWPQR